MKRLTRSERSTAVGRLCLLALLSAAAPLTGCHSAFINATLVNHSGHAVHLVEMDYPSASFGTETLPPDGTFHYRFKVVGQGPLKLTWTDTQQKEHTEEGPTLHEGQEGALTVTMAPGRLAWQTTLRER